MNIYSITFSFTKEIDEAWLKLHFPQVDPKNPAQEHISAILRDWIEIEDAVNADEADMTVTQASNEYIEIRIRGGSTFKGTVQFSFSLGDKKFEGTVVHARRRIELRFNDGALVMVKFKERVVSSEDIDITEQDGIWAIGNHGLDVRFRGTDGFTFAELRNSDGSTILASAG